ncbi:hypothetical protein OIU92_00120 [Escherichia coli]|nr:hypothetical protein [Escherichia coli]
MKYPVWQTVGAHNRTMNIPQREFLGLSFCQPAGAATGYQSFLEGEVLP